MRQEKGTVVIVGTVVTVMLQDEVLVHGMEVLEVGHMNIGGNGEILQPTKVFAKAGLDIVTSTMCRHQQQFGLDVQCSALALTSTTYFQMGICTGLDNQ